MRVFLLTLLAVTTAHAQDSYEPNDSFSQAATVSLGTDYSATLHESGDRDYFSVTTAEAGVLYVRLLSVPGPLQLRVTVYDDQQREIENYVGNTGTIFRTPANAAPGTYYIRVDRYTGTSTSDPYQFRVELDRNDPFEPNGSFSAAAVAPLDTDLTGILDPSDDRDYLRVETPGPGVLVARLTEVPGDYSIRTTVYNGNQNEQISYVGNSGTIFATPIQTSGEVHYVRFDRYNGTPTRTPYRFRLEYDPTDSYETNGSFSEAKAIPGNETLTAQLVPDDDLDYYTFTAASDGDVSLRVLSVPSDLSLRVALYGSDQREVDSWTTSTAASETYPLSAGTYYVRVSRYSGDGSLTPYTFSVEGGGLATPAESLPSSEAATLSAPTPNPFREAARLTLTVQRSERVTAAIYDVLGRRVVTLHDGPVHPNAPLVLSADGSALAPGLYVVRIDGEVSHLTRRVVRVR